METNSEKQNERVALTVADADSGKRLDAYLADQIPGWSRARLQRLIDEDEVFVNGNTSKASYKLRTGDEIELELTPPPSATFVPEEIPLDIVFEDDDLVVVNKPAGLVVHPAAGIQSGTLANGLAYHFQTLATRGGNARPGIVHRLDRGTSGLIVVAKTEVAHEHLSNQFRAREVYKNYAALVHGTVKEQSGRIEQPLARDPRNRTRMAVVPGGRSALSIYRVRRHYNGFTLVDVELKTGRTHQIRVHMSWLKHPVVADELYGQGRDGTVKDPQIRARIRKLNRHFLHAEQLGFQHPRTGEQVKFSSPLPDELQDFLKHLEGQER